MESNKINIEITAKINDLEKKLKRAEGDLKKFESSTKKTSKAVSDLGQTTQVNAVPALQEFSRVVQDAPYGIQGVANNIQQLTANFGYLSQKTGGAKEALGAMVGALTGPAGILLAVSLVTSAWISYGDEIKAFFQTSNPYLVAHRKELDKITESIYRQGEAIGLINNTISLGLQNAVLEARAAGKTEQEVYEIKKKWLKAQIQLADSIHQQSIENAKKVNKELNAIRARGGEVDLKLQEDASAKVVEAERNAKRLRELLYRQELEEKLRLKKEYDKKINVKATPQQTSDFSYFSDQLNKGEMFTDPFGFKQMAIEVETDLANLNLKVKEGTDEIYTSLDQFNDNITKLINFGIGSAFASIGVAIGSALAESTNVADALGKALLGTFGSILTQLGQMAIEVGVGLLAVQLALKSLNPYVAIAAGVALIALGSYFSSSVKNLGSSMGSGNSAAGIPDNSGASSGCTTTPAYESAGGNQVVFRVRGNDLVGVLASANKQNIYSGGTTKI